MSCLITGGFAYGCRDSVAGIKAIYIANYNENQTYTLDSANVITAVGITSPADAYYTYFQNPETAMFDQTLNASNGAVFYKQSLTLQFPKNGNALKNLIVTLNQARLSVIVKDASDNYWLMGVHSGVYSTSGSLNSGKVLGDFNGVNLVLEANDPSPAYKIDDINLFDIVE